MPSCCCTLCRAKEGRERRKKVKERKGEKGEKEKEKRREDQAKGRWESKRKGGRRYLFSHHFIHPSILPLVFPSIYAFIHHTLPQRTAQVLVVLAIRLDLEAHLFQEYPIRRTIHACGALRLAIAGAQIVMANDNMTYGISGLPPCARRTLNTRISLEKEK